MSEKTAIASDPKVVIQSGDEPLHRYAAWQPRWKVDLGDGDTIGIAIDDGCFVVLYPHGDAWRPGTHIPKEAADQIAKLAKSGALG